MEAELVTTSTAAKGSLAAVASASKAFIAAHPIGLAVTGGALLGLGTYYALGKMFGKKKISPATVVSA